MAWLNGGMLRITLPTYGSGGVFALQGKLTGLSTQELLREARQANQGYGNNFDLQEVTYADSAGGNALRILNDSDRGLSPIRPTGGIFVSG
jgi:anti-anti-sigma regulatory factor